MQRQFRRFDFTTSIAGSFSGALPPADFSPGTSRLTGLVAEGQHLTVDLPRAVAVTRRIRVTGL